MERSATGMGVRGLANRSLPTFLVSVDTSTREGLAFVVLAAAAVTIGIAVIGALAISFAPSVPALWVLVVLFGAILALAGFEAVPLSVGAVGLCYVGALGLLVE
jgi:hypothetical protein